MTSRELTLELLKFNPQEVAAVYDLGWALDVGMRPTQEQIVDAVFALERLAESYPAYAYVYKGLLAAIDQHLAVSEGVANPGVIQLRDAALEEGIEAEQDASFEANVQVKKTLVDGQPVMVDYPKEGLKFNFGTCNHGEVPEDVLIEQLLADEGALPPPWVRYAESFNLTELSAEDSAESSDAQDAEHVDFEGRHLALAANRAPSRKPSLKLVKVSRAAKELSAIWNQLELKPSNLLSSNPKLSKGGKECYLAAGLFLSPWTYNGVANVCPYASKGCSASCLNESGQAEIAKNVQHARKRRTKLILQHRNAFAPLLVRSISWWESQVALPPEKWLLTFQKLVGYRSPITGEVFPDAFKCRTHDFCLRLNNTSDLAWEAMEFDWHDGQPKATAMQKYPQYQFYDYTKNPHRMLRFLEGSKANWPKNYYLTFSWSEINADLAFNVLDHGGNVAVVFDTFQFQETKHKLPDMFCGYPVIDADVTDLRFMDNEPEAHQALRAKYGTGLICGLRLKGTRHKREFAARAAAERAQGLPLGKLTGGFVQYSEDCGMDSEGHKIGPNITNTREYKQMVLDGAKARAALQAQEGFTSRRRERV